MTIQEKRERIIELRKAGATYEQISDALGYPKHSHGGGFVSKVLRESGHITSSDERTERRQSVLEFLKNGGTYDEAAERFCLSVGYVKQIYHKSGAIRSGKEKRNTEMRAYKAEGHSMKEVAERFGVSEGCASQICKGIAPQTSRRPQVYRNGWDADKQVANAIRTINEKIPMFEYVGGFTNTDGFADIRCKTCGAVLHKSFVSIRRGRAKCDNCERIAFEEKEKQKERDRKIDAEKKAWEQAGKAKAKQLSFSICKGCGSLFYSERLGVQYCTIDCQKRTLNAIGKDKRLKKMMGIVVDRNITVEKLYKKSNGVCAICGGQCDWGDHVLRDDGTFVVGAMYPSIDHVKPISKGGLHEWSNVQLAHLSCNSKKSNKI